MIRIQHLATGILLLLGSCVKNESPILADGTFEASVVANLHEMPIEEPELADTKAQTQYTVRIKWTAGDKLSVVNLTTGKLLGGNLSANETGFSSTFSGSLKGTVNTGDRIAYFYPAKDNASEIPFPGFSVDMSSQKGTATAVPLCVYSVVTADANSFQNASISFDFFMSYIMLGMSDIPATAQIKAVTLTNVTDRFDVSLNAGRTGFVLTPHTGDIVLTPGQAASASGVRTLYVAVPGSVATTERSIILETSVTSFETSFTGAALKNGTAYNTNVVGFLKDDLSFEDSRVRAYCLSHFDANGDGKLSLVEIASVTTFPDDPLPSDIICFDELEFFYGLTTFPSFKNRKDLVSVTVPRQISSIAAETFYGCSVLSEIYLKPETPPALGNNAFYGTPESLLMIVSDTSLPDYLSAPGWRNYPAQLTGNSNVNGSSVRIHTEGENMNAENTVVNL